MKDTVKLRWALGLFVALSFAAIGVACDDSTDDVLPMADAAVDGSIATDTKAGDTAADAPKSVPVGATCYLQTDCSGDTNFCVKNPPTSPATVAGSCNVIGCNLKPGSCPVSTLCVDVSQFTTLAPAGTFLCIDKKLLVPPDGGADGGGDAGGDASHD